MPRGTSRQNVNDDRNISMTCRYPLQGIYVLDCNIKIEIMLEYAKYPQLVMCVP